MLITYKLLSFTRKRIKYIQNDIITMSTISYWDVLKVESKTFVIVFIVLTNPMDTIIVFLAK